MKKYNEFNTLEAAVADAMKAYYPETDGMFAVIVSTQISMRNYSVGVQYWTSEDLKERMRKNTDHTVSEKLYVRLAGEWVNTALIDQSAEILDLLTTLYWNGEITDAHLNGKIASLFHKIVNR